MTTSTALPPTSQPAAAAVAGAAPLPPDWQPVPEFQRATDRVTLEQVAERLRQRNFGPVIVDSAEEARDEVLKRLPDGAEVHTAKSRTLEEMGVFGELMGSERWDMVRHKTMAMDRKTQMREIRKIQAAPDVMIGSVQAVTESGQMVVASAAGSQIGPYSGAAGQLILVVGSQKIVPDLETALRRITEHVQPYEDLRLREQIGMGTFVARILIMERDYIPGRTTVILVREPVGI